MALPGERMKTLSILMATYNGEQFLEAQLASLAAQTRLPEELVISDDCSTDRTLEIATRFAQTAPFPVKIHVNATRLGWAANFVSGTSLCSGELVAFCDQDDVWLDSKLATMVRLFSSADVLLACHDAFVVDMQLNRQGLLNRLPAEQAFYRPLELAPWSNALGFTQVIDRSLLTYSKYWKLSVDVDRRPRPMAHDQWFSFLASVLGVMVHTPETLALYRQHGGNSVGAKPLETRVPGAHERTRRYLVPQLEASESRELVLKHMLAEADGPAKVRIEEACKQYAALSFQLRNRATIYTSDSRAMRLKSLLQLAVHSRQLKAAGWRYAPRFFLKDIVWSLRRKPESDAN